MTSLANIAASIIDATRIKKTDTYFAILVALFSVCVVLSNIIAVKVCSISMLEFDCAVFIFPVTFLCIDLINETFGPKYARRAILIGVSLQLLAFTVLQIAVHLPYSPAMTEFSEQFSTVLGTSSRAIIASLISLAISQLIDVKLFTAIKKRFPYKWMRSGISTAMSQIIDSALFITIVFIGTVPNLLMLFLTMSAVKLSTIFIAVPLFYFFTRKARKALANSP